MDLVRFEVGGIEVLFKVFWYYLDVIVCCVWKVSCYICLLRMVEILYENFFEIYYMLLGGLLCVFFFVFIFWFVV